MGTKATLIQAPIKGVFDREINVGDKVLVVTTGYSHRTNLREGTYKGYVEGSGYYKQRARIEIAAVARTWYNKATGEKYDYRKHGWWSNEMKDNFEVKTEPYTYETTLNLNRIATLKD